MRCRRLPALILLFALLTSLSASAQKPAEKKNPTDTNDQDQPIKMTTTLVEVRAVVTDKQGQPVRDLKQEDFEVVENKQPQEISFFSQITVGLGVSNPTAGAPQPTAGAAPSAVPSRVDNAQRPVRSIVLFVDNLHLSDSSLILSKQTLKRFITEKLTNDDLVAVMTSGGTLGLFSQFTRDRRILQTAVDKIGARGINRQSLFSPYLAAQIEIGNRDAMNFGIQILQQEESLMGDRRMMEGIASGRARQILSEATYQRRVTLATLKALTDRMADLPGQRLIVALSDGFTLSDSSGRPDTGDLNTVTSKAAVSGVVIYTIDAKGLEPPALFDASLRGPIGSNASWFVNGSSRDAEDSLNALAKDTGGETFLNTNDLVGAVRKAVDNNGLYYALGYYPLNDEQTTKFRKITVRVRNHPEYNVRAQQGYLPSVLAKERKSNEAKNPQQRLAEAAVAPLAFTDIGIFTTADFIETEKDAAQVTLQVFIEGSKLQYRNEKERHHFALEMISLIFDASGKNVKSETTNIQTALLPEKFERSRQLGYRYLRRIELKPGTYQVRVGVREVATGKVGSAAALVQVPDLTGKRLSVSSLLLMDPVTMDHVATLNKETVTLQGGTRQGIKWYRNNEMLGFYLRLYPPAKAPANELSSLTYLTEILQGERVVAETGWKPLPAGLEMPKGVELGRQIPLEGLPTGLYELKVTIKTSKSKAVIERTAAFEIVR